MTESGEPGSPGEGAQATDAAATRRRRAPARAAVDGPGVSRRGAGRKPATTPEAADGSAQRAAGSGQKAAGSGENPAGSGQKAAGSGENPAASGRQAAGSGQKPVRQRAARSIAGPDNGSAGTVGEAHHVEARPGPGGPRHDGPAERSASLGLLTAPADVAVDLDVALRPRVPSVAEAVSPTGELSGSGWLASRRGAAWPLSTGSDPVGRTIPEPAGAAPEGGRIPGAYLPPSPAGWGTVGSPTSRPPGLAERPSRVSPASPTTSTPPASPSQPATTGPTVVATSPVPAVPAVGPQASQAPMDVASMNPGRAATVARPDGLDPRLADDERVPGARLGAVAADAAAGPLPMATPNATDAAAPAAPAVATDAAAPAVPAAAGPNEPGPAEAAHAPSAPADGEPILDIVAYGLTVAGAAIAGASFFLPWASQESALIGGPLGDGYAEKWGLAGPAAPLLVLLALLVVTVAAAGPALERRYGRAAPVLERLRVAGLPLVAGGAFGSVAWIYLTRPPYAPEYGVSILLVGAALLLATGLLGLVAAPSARR